MNRVKLPASSIEQSAMALAARPVRRWVRLTHLSLEYLVSLPLGPSHHHILTFNTGCHKTNKLSNGSPSLKALMHNQPTGIKTTEARQCNSLLSDLQDEPLCHCSFHSQCGRPGLQEATWHNQTCPESSCNGSDWCYLTAVVRTQDRTWGWCVAFAADRMHRIRPGQWRFPR